MSQMRFKYVGAEWRDTVAVSLVSNPGYINNT